MLQYFIDIWLLLAAITLQLCVHNTLLEILYMCLWLEKHIWYSHFLYEVASLDLQIIPSLQDFNAIVHYICRDTYLCWWLESKSYEIVL